MEFIKSRFRKPKTSINLKLNKKSRAALVFALIIIVAALVLYQTSRSKADCAQLVNETNSLLDNLEHKTALDRLKPHQEKCGPSLQEKDIKDEAKTAQTMAAVRFNANLAKAEYVAGNKQNASAAVDKIYEAKKHMSASQREQLSEDSNFFFDLFDIKNNLYEPLPPEETAPTAEKGTQ